MLRKHIAFFISAIMVLATFISIANFNEASDTQDTKDPPPGFDLLESWEKQGVIFERDYGWGVHWPYVIYHEGIYKMWYAGMTGSQAGTIFYATSVDGNNWVGNQSVITTPASESYSVAPSVLIEDDGTYKMWFTRRSNDNYYRILYATSTDGINWVEEGAVLTPTESFERTGIAQSKVIKDGGEYKMWYYVNGGGTIKIAYATSPDGMTWTKHGPVLNPPPGYIKVHAPHVIKNENGSYTMYFGAKTGIYNKIFKTYSTDGINWGEEKLIVNVGNQGEPDDIWAACPFVLNDTATGNLTMYYSGWDGSESRMMKAVQGYLLVNNTKYSDYSISGLQTKNEIFKNEAIDISASISFESNEYDESWIKTGIVYDSPHSNGVTYPFVLYHEGIYKMWYAGMYGPQDAEIYYAESPDGVNWSSHQMVLSNTGFDYIVAPSVLIEDDGTYKMWVTRRNDEYDISIYNSNDGINWAFGGVVMEKGPSGSFDDDSVAVGKVFKEDGTYKMYYRAYDGSTSRFGYATSSDGYIWTKHGPIMEDSGEFPYIHVPYVMPDGEGNYDMWFQSKNGYPRVHQSFSEDGISWKNTRMVLDVGEGGEADISGTTCPYVINDPVISKKVMYYSGWDGNEYKIMRAIENEVDRLSFNTTFYLDELAPENIIGQVNETEAINGSEVAVSTSWHATTPGNHTILVKIDGFGTSDDNSSNNLAYIDIYVKKPDLKINKTCDRATAHYTDEIWYTLAVTNTGDEELENIFVNDTLPDGLILQAGYSLEPYSVEAVGDGTLVTWLIDHLAMGETLNITYDALVSFNKAVYYNSPSASDGTYTYLYPDAYGVTPSIFGVDSYDYWGDPYRHYNYRIEVDTGDPVTVQVFDPDTVGAYDEGPRDCVGDEVVDYWDTITEFTIIKPGGSTLTKSYGNDSATDNQWVDLFTLEGAGYYVLDVKTVSGEEENGYNVRLTAGTEINPVGRMCVNFNRDGQYALFMQGVDSNIPTFEVCKYDADVGATSLIYKDPDGIDHVGTLCDNGQWSNDTLPVKEGVWTVTYDAGASDTSTWIFGLEEVLTNTVTAWVTDGDSEASSADSSSIVVTLRDSQPLPSTLLGAVSVDAAPATIQIDLEGPATYDWNGNEGYYEFFDILPGEYLITATASGYFPYSDSVIITEGDRTQLDIHLTSTDQQAPTHLNETPADESYGPAGLPTISIDIFDGSGIDTGSVVLSVNGTSVSHTLAALSGGQRVICSDALSFNAGETVTCGIVAADMASNTLFWNWTFIASEVYNLNLVKGMNLISFPLAPIDASLESILAPIDGKWDIVRTYEDGEWLHYRVGALPKYQSLFSMSQEKGYWLNVTEDGVVLPIYGMPVTSEIPLDVGWNLVGYPTMDVGVTVGDAFWGTGVTAVCAFDVGSPYRMLEVGPDHIMVTGEGYWAYVNADTTWTVEY